MGWPRPPASPASWTGCRVFDDLAAGAEPDQLDRRLQRFADEGRRGELVALHTRYRERLDELGVRDRAGGHARAAVLLGSRLEAWDETPVFAYGFEDMSGVQISALTALAARCPVMVSLPYETGRPAMAAVRPVVEALTAVPHELVELPAAALPLAGAGAPGADAVRRAGCGAGSAGRWLGGAARGLRRARGRRPGRL